MAIIRQKRNSKFSIMSNEMLSDPNMSFKARGLLAYMLSKPDDWKFYVSELTDHSDKDGEKAIRSALNEMENAGYLKRSMQRDKNGKFISRDFLLFDEPTALPHTENRLADKGLTANGLADKGRLLRTDSTKNLNKLNTDNKEHSPAKAEPHLPYKEIIDYLNEKLGTSYQVTSKKTQTLIHARFNEKFSLDDFKQVIDNKVAEWFNTDMSKYLRPETLFGTKFESYLNQKPKTNEKEKDWFGDY